MKEAGNLHGKIEDYSKLANRLPKELKKVPPDRKERDRIRTTAQKIGKDLTHEQVSDKKNLQRIALGLLKELELGNEYLGFAMVSIGNVVFGRNFYAVPFEKRLLLLPHCLRNRKKCTGKYDDVQFHCSRCGSCFLGRVKKEAEKLGYTVLIAEGTPIIVRILAETDIVGVLGVSCLDSMEKSFEKVQMGGMPAVAVPLLVDGCKDTSVDETEVLTVLRKRLRKGKTRRKPLLDTLAESVFQTVLQYYPKPNNDIERLAFDYLTKGGKRFRPLLVVAAYSLLSNTEKIPDHIYKTALAIEMFHKASLVHDDIEDNAGFRYGMPTLHKRYGLPIAINTGDFLVGLGYKLIIEGIESTSRRMEILNVLSSAHTYLAIGQGTELLWQKGELDALTPENVLTCYAQKTGNAFRASILTGALLADADKDTINLLDDFSIHFGKAFQLHDDLDGFKQDNIDARTTHNGLFEACPSIILAFVLDSLPLLEKKKLRIILQKQRINENDVKNILHYIEKTDAERRTKEQQKKETAVCQNILVKIKSKPMAGFLKKLLRRALQ